MANNTLCEVDDCPTPDLCRSIGCQAIYARKAGEDEAAAGDPDITVGVMAEDRDALVARLRELEQTCLGMANLEPDEGGPQQQAWMERAEAAHYASAALTAAPATPEPERPTPRETLVEHDIVARDRDGQPWCLRCRQWVRDGTRCAALAALATPPEAR